MPKAKTYCGRKPGHKGVCLTAETLARSAANHPNRFPRKTARRVGVRGADNQAVQRRWRRNGTLRRYGLTPESFELLLAAQDYACGMCREPFEEGQLVYIDHNHDCCGEKSACDRCRRGLLCLRCNTGLGYVERLGDLARAYLALW